ncbi:NifX-associated nitrogen fixation protein [Mesorhizobium sp. M0088]
MVTRKQRRAIPIIGDPEPDVLWRLDILHRCRARDRGALRPDDTANH